MKNIIKILVIATGMITMLTGAAWGAVTVKKDLVMLPNTKGETSNISIEVTAEGEDAVTAYSEDGIATYWKSVAGTEDRWILTLNVEGKPAVGNNALTLRGATTGEICHIYVFIYDNRKPIIEDVEKGKNSLNLIWETKGSEYSQVQYRIAGGKWKTAAKMTKEKHLSFNRLVPGSKYEFRVRPVSLSQEWGVKYGPWSKTFTQGFKVKKEMPKPVEDEKEQGEKTRAVM